jgi:hypothetical protein
MYLTNLASIEELDVVDSQLRKLIGWKTPTVERLGDEFVLKDGNQAEKDMYTRRGVFIKLMRKMRFLQCRYFGCGGHRLRIVNKYFSS